MRQLLTELLADVNKLQTLRRGKQNIAHKQLFRLADDMARVPVEFPKGNITKELLYTASLISNMNLSIQTSNGSILHINDLRSRPTLEQAEIQFISDRVLKAWPPALKSHLKDVPFAVKHLLTGAAFVTNREFHLTVMGCYDHYLVAPLEGIFLLAGCAISFNVRRLNELLECFCLHPIDLTEHIHQNDLYLMKTLGTVQVVKLR
jgi:hypothetical protein